MVHKPKLPQKNHKKLAINTYILEKPQRTILKQTSSPSKQTKSPSNKKVVHTKKIVKKPTPAKKTQKPAKKHVSTKQHSKQTSSQTQKLLKDMQESIAKIETNRDNCQLTKKVSVPKPIEELKTASYHIASEEVKEIALDYQDLLTKVLKDELTLPAFGKVKVKITVEADGEISRIETTFSDSEVNRLYLEKNLPNITLPRFIGELAHSKQHCFSLVFCSDEH